MRKDTNVDMQYGENQRSSHTINPLFVVIT